MPHYCFPTILAHKGCNPLFFPPFPLSTLTIPLPPEPTHHYGQSFIHQSLHPSLWTPPIHPSPTPFIIQPHTLLPFALATHLVTFPVIPSPLPQTSGSLSIVSTQDQCPFVMGLGETLHLSSHKYTGPLSIVKIAKVMYCSGSQR